MSKVKLIGTGYTFFFWKGFNCCNIFYVCGIDVILNSRMELSATNAGIIQTGLVVGFAIALYLSSYYSDFINPNKILLFALTNSIGAFFFYYANDFLTALIFNTILGAAAGRIYGPSMILVSEKFNRGNKGFAMGICLEANLLAMQFLYRLVLFFLIFITIIQDF